jgi:hypothetical protein
LLVTSSGKFTFCFVQCRSLSVVWSGLDGCQVEGDVRCLCDKFMVQAT